MSKKIKYGFLVIYTVFLSCKTDTKPIVVNEIPEEDKITFITVDPGHFHAALVQKSTYKEVDTTVFIYAPEGDDVDLHLKRIEAYNIRVEDPTNWNSIVYTGDDFFEKMIAEKKGGVVVLAGNNQKKTEYIKEAVEAGLNVLADKPMAINGEDFELLKQAFDTAAKNNLVLYDIMTERFEITSILQKELAMNKDIFGDLEKGSADNPAVIKESIHHFHKNVSGSILTRPPWFFDVEQEGEGIVDVTTHLVDLVQWQCFPEQVLNYETDVVLNSATREPTFISMKEFKDVTKLDYFPSYLKQYMTNDSTIAVFCNGEINYKIKDVYAKVAVNWNYKAPEGTGDTHFSIIKGSKASLTIKQGAEQAYKPTLYIEPVDANDEYVIVMEAAFNKLKPKFPGIELKRTNNIWEVVIPDSYSVGHEAHFAQVTEKFIEYLTKGNIPEWEIPNMITKYYITTKALEIAKEK